MHSERYTSGSITKALLTFTGPYVLGMILQNLYGAVDLLVVGQFATTADVSAVTIGSQLMGMATQCIIGLATGVTVLVGKYFGAGQEQKLSKTVGSSILLFAGISSLVTLVYLVFGKGIVSLMQTPEAAVAPTRQYLTICTIGILFIVGYNVISSIWMGLGDTRTPFIFIFIACVINIVLDIVLVKVIPLGAMGAAIATSIAQAGSFFFSLLYVRKKGLGFPVKKQDIRLDKTVIGETVKVGTPVAIQNVLVGASFLFITAVINQIGLEASAAVGVVEKLFGFLIMPAAAFGAAVATVAAQNIGAGHIARARKSMWNAIWMALVPSAIAVLASLFAGEWMARIFNSDPQVVALAAVYLKSYATDCLLVSFVFCMNGFFNSNSYSWFSMLHSLITTFLVRVPASYLLSKLSGGNLFAIGWAAPLSTLASLVLCLLFLRKVYSTEDRRLAQVAEAEEETPATALAGALLEKRQPVQQDAP